MPTSMPEDDTQDQEQSDLADLGETLIKQIQASALSPDPVIKPAAPLPPLIREDIGDRQSDRQLKQNYANWFFGLLIGQLVVMNLVFIAVGIGGLHYEKWVLDLYLGGTLAEVFGVVYVITKNLFPERQGSTQ